MVLLSKINPEAVHDNLKARHTADQIYVTLQKLKYFLDLHWKRVNFH
jgi:hypothetical protein